HIGIAADMIQTSDKVIDPSIQAFQKDVLSIYQNEVLDNDFSSTQDINILIEKYPDEEVRKF
ncbi:MAG: hypothetical protein QN834_11870, partial [Nitrososphaeraceae archaeon]|nr:hypothetical protein [Nitrososphaeraceae archaeon]